LASAGKLRPVAFGVGATAVAVVQLFVWGALNVMGKLSAAFDPAVDASSGMIVVGVEIPSPLPFGIGIALFGALILAAIVYMLSPRVIRGLSPLVFLIGPLLVWAPIAIQYAGQALQHPVVQEEWTVVSSASEFVSVTLAILVPWVAVALIVRSRREFAWARD